MRKESLQIMVVDDMSTSRGLITQALDEVGILSNRSESNGKSALSSIQKFPVHLVVSDYNMPEMNGLQLLQNIRSNKYIKNTGFILVTGTPTKEIVDLGKRLGMNNLLRKPFSALQMKSCIEQVVGRLS